MSKETTVYCDECGEEIYKEDDSYRMRVETMLPGEGFWSIQKDLHYCSEKCYTKAVKRVKLKVRGEMQPIEWP
ncbi:MAG: hypothetical protein N2V78_09415 [Methanophagales archaeon]|nr:hypothetical protein [Methanophagales archaeon]